MFSSFIAIFVAVLAPMAVLSSPQWHPYGPPPAEHRQWHHGPPGLKPSATSSIAAGILPTGVVGAGSTGTPAKLYGQKKEEGVSGVAGASSTGTPKLVVAPAANASVSLSRY